MAKLQTRNVELMADFEQAFEAMSKELKFKATLDEIDAVFFIRDGISYSGFVSNQVSRTVCGRIAGMYADWARYMQTLISPHDVISMVESSAFSDEDKLEIEKLISKMYAMTVRNTHIGLTKDKVAEGKYVDEALDLWHSSIKTKLAGITKKIQETWQKRGA